MGRIWLINESIRHPSEFEVIAYVTEGEVIVENNNLTTTATFTTSERKTGILPSPSIPIVIFAIIILANTVRRKPN